MSSNRVTIIGHLGQDPELRYLANGQAVGRFSVATDEPYTDKEGRRQERTEWHQIVVFGKVAETCKKYLARGRQVYVEGRLRTREYEARNNGGKRQRTEIVASRVQFLGTPPTDAKGATAVEEPVRRRTPRFLSKTGAWGRAMRPAPKAMHRVRVGAQ